MFCHNHRKTVFRIALLLIPLLVTGCFHHSERKYDPSKVDFDVSYNSLFDGIIYPSLILGVSGYNGATPDDEALFTVSLVSPANNAVLRVEFDSTILSYVTILQEEMPRRGETYTFHPLIKWKYDVLYAMRRQGMVDFTATCYVNDERVAVRNFRLNFRSANECPICLRDVSGQAYSFRWLFAGYVNEDHPYIDSILTQILDQRVVTSFVGYQKGSRQVSEQVFAFWYYALERGIAYSSISCTSNPSAMANVQRIRFFDEVYNSRQANCIDACVFFASLMRKIGLKPVIFVEPCHAYLGYYTDKKRRHIKLLETTITSWVSFPEMDRHLTASGRLDDKYYLTIQKYLSDADQHRYAQGKLSYDELKMSIARNLFEKASEYNTENHAANAAYFADTANVAYQQLDIENLRRLVQPIN